MAKISKEAKKFKEYYELGSIWLPKILIGLYLIHDYRAMYCIKSTVLNAMFEEKGYYLHINNNADFSSDDMSLGKGSERYMSLNSGVSIIPAKPIPVHSIVKSACNDISYMQYVQRETPVFGMIKFDNFPVRLPEGLDIMNLPEESLFQTELCIDTQLVQGAAVWMGLRDFGFVLGDVIYYGDSLLKMKQLFAVVESVVLKLREQYKDK